MIAITDFSYYLYESLSSLLLCFILTFLGTVVADLDKFIRDTLGRVALIAGAFHASGVIELLSSGFLSYLGVLGGQFISRESCRESEVALCLDVSILLKKEKI